ncbi:MAG: enoyl-CoA hydratase [Actinomycetota bacterium]
MEEILVKADGAVTQIVLNRPERRNPLSLSMMGEVIEALTTLPADTQVVVVSGAGRAFSAGHDLTEVVAADLEQATLIFDRCTEMMVAIQRIPQPVIARVHGVATAAGCQLVAATDLAVAARSARFATPGVRIGLFCATPMVPLTRAIGRKRSMEMLLTGEMIDANTAADWGLVNRVVDDDQLDTAVDELVDSILGYSPAAIGLGKRAFYAQIDVDQAQAYDHTKAVMVANAMMDDSREGISAFLEKRSPKWTGR